MRSGAPSSSGELARLARHGSPEILLQAPDEISSSSTSREISSSSGCGDGPSLHYWHREGGRPGEIDYLIPSHGRVLPIEIKASASGAMKSLHQFMFDKKLRTAVRCDMNPPSAQDLAVTTTQGNEVRFRLINIPLYLLWNVHSILEGLF